MANSKNELLKKAFCEAAKKETDFISGENQFEILYSERHKDRMKKLFREKETAKGRQFVCRRFAVIAAAVMLIVSVTITASAGIAELFDFADFDSEKYTRTQWVIDEAYTTGTGADEFVEVVYNGKPITVKYSLDTGENSDFPERALMVFVNGVRQSFDAVVGDKEYEEIEILPLERGLGTTQYAELTFRPAMGNKGDILALEIVAVFDPDNNFYPECEGSSAHFDDDNNDICDICGANLYVGPSSLTIMNEAFAKIIMNKNAPAAEDKICENFSGYVESELHKKIYDCYNYNVYGSESAEVVNEYESLESLCAIFYNDIDENLVYDENGGLLLQTEYVTTAKQTDKYTINLHGKSGIYRVAFYIGTDPQPVFDGKEYVDVEIRDGKQVELNIDIDTTKLAKENNFSVVYKHIGENLFEDFRWFSQQICEGTIVVG